MVAFCSGAQNNVFIRKKTQSHMHQLQALKCYCIMCYLLAYFFRERDKAVHLENFINSQPQ